MTLGATGGHLPRGDTKPSPTVQAYGSPKGIMFDKFTSKRPVCTVTKNVIPKIPPHGNTALSRAKSTERPSNLGGLTARNYLQQSFQNIYQEASTLYGVGERSILLSQNEDRNSVIQSEMPPSSNLKYTHDLQSIVDKHLNSNYNKYSITSSRRSMKIKGTGPFTGSG